MFSAVSPCASLPEMDNGHWNDSECLSENFRFPTVCRMICAPGYSLFGTLDAISCQPEGFLSPQSIPVCQGRPALKMPKKKKCRWLGVCWGEGGERAALMSSTFLQMCGVLIALLFVF